VAQPRAAIALAPLIAVVSAKGGVGRSTVAVNLASVLAQKQRVALCDLDLQFSDASSWGAEPPERTIDQLAAVVGAGEVQLADIQAIAQQRFGAVTLLPGVPSPLEGAAWAGERGIRALRLVTALRRWFEVVVVDDLPGLLEPVVGISRSAQLLVVVTTCEVGALRATKRYLGLLDRFAPVPRLIVANRSNRGQSAKLVRAALGAAERIVFLKEDRTFARRLVVEGLAASGQRGRGVSRTFSKLAAQVRAALEPR
jgi:pilus assembly protein CpaE